MQKRKPILQSIPVEFLKPGRFQPRQQFDPIALQELADSIRAMGGLLQPIVVRELKQNQYEIIAGERRWRAAQLAQMHEVNCLIHNYSDEQALQAALIENLMRANLNPIETAQAYQRMIDEFHYLHDEIALALGKSRVSITNTLRLLKLHPDIQNAIADNQLSEGHGKLLAALDLETQKKLGTDCIQKQYPVRKLEFLIKKYQLQQAQVSTPSIYSDQQREHLEHALSDHVGNRVGVDYQAQGGGHLNIRFNNIDELEGIFDKIGFSYDSFTGETKR